MLCPTFSVKSLKLVTPLVMAPIIEDIPYRWINLCTVFRFFSEKSTWWLLLLGGDDISWTWHSLSHGTVRSTTFPTLFDFFGCKLVYWLLNKTKALSKKKQGGFYLYIGTWPVKRRCPGGPVEIARRRHGNDGMHIGTDLSFLLRGFLLVHRKILGSRLPCTQSPPRTHDGFIGGRQLPKLPPTENVAVRRYYVPAGAAVIPYGWQRDRYCFARN
jgi:hypothetical protein